jgi:hypothetical protein
MRTLGKLRRSLWGQPSTVLHEILQVARGARIAGWQAWPPVLYYAYPIVVRLQKVIP